MSHPDLRHILLASADRAHGGMPVDIDIDKAITTGMRQFRIRMLAAYAGVTLLISLLAAGAIAVHFAIKAPAVVIAADESTATTAGNAASATAVVTPTSTTGEPDTGNPGPATLSAIQISPAAVTVTVGTAQQLTATGTYSDGFTTDITHSVRWSVSDAAVASVDGTGLLTAGRGGPGRTEVRAALSGQEVTAEVTTELPELTGITITPDAVRLVVGKSLQLSAIGTYSDGSTADITGSVQWTSDEPVIADVDTAGLVTAIDVIGQTDVRAWASGLSATVRVTTEARTLTALTVSPKTSASCVSRFQLEAIGTFSDGSTEDMTERADWINDNPHAAALYRNVVSALPAAATGDHAVSVTASSDGMADTFTLDCTPADTTDPPPVETSDVPPGPDPEAPGRAPAAVINPGTAPLPAGTAASAAPTAPALAIAATPN